MALLVIEHPVASFDSWKTAFESDPIGRRQNGVIRHAIYRSSGQSNDVCVHLEFASHEKAEEFLIKLRGLWDKAGDRLGFGNAEGVRARLFDEVEKVDY